MNKAVMYADLHAPAEALPWDFNFNDHGLTLVRAGSMREVQGYLRAYEVLLVILQLPETINATILEEVGQVAEARKQEQPPPLLGIYAEDPGHATRAELCKAGVALLLSRNDPHSSFDWLFKQMLLLEDLRKFEQTRMDVHEMARQTRVQMHDLSQPLSALLGRLQLMAVKCAPDDPLGKTYTELAGLAIDVSRHLSDIQQSHRKFS